MLKSPFPDVSVLGKLANLKSPVETLVLAARAEDIEDLNPTQIGLTVFLTDWLDWVTWRQRAGQAVHPETCLETWPEELGEQDSFVQRAVTWMYKDGQDVSLFQDVSLGKQFNWEVTGVCLAYGRIWTALTRAVQALRPQRIEFRALRVEYDFLDPASLKALAMDVAQAHGIDFIDRSDLARPGLDPELPFNGEFSPQSLSRRLMLRAIELSIYTVSRTLGLFRKPAPRVFVLHNLLVVNSLIEHLPVGKAIPVLLARIHPKRPSFLQGAWRKGVRLVAFSNVKLKASHKRQLDDLRIRLKARCDAESATPWNKAALAFVRSYVLAPGILEGKALEVLQFKRMLERERPARILVGDSENHMTRLVCEVAQGMGIGVDELPNGMFLTGQRMDSRAGDGFRKPVIDRLLAWGKSNLCWAERARVAVPVVETGYPVAESLHRTPAPTPASAGRALILPLHVDKTDLCGLYSEVFVNLIKAVHAANEAGYDDIRIKVHPGFMHLDYYRETARRFGLKTDILIDGPLLEHIIWSDIVIGPVNSGAMIETAALGRPYFSVLNPPTAIEPALASPAKAIWPQQLAEALVQNAAEDNPALLSGIAGYSADCPSGNRVWQAILSATRGDTCRTCA